MPISPDSPPDPVAATRWREANAIPLITAAAALLLLGWDATGLDLPLARASGTASGFPLRENWLLYAVLHEGGRFLSWFMVLSLTLAVWWPLGFFSRISMAKRLQLAMTTLISLAAISALKSSTGISCPWDLTDFGGVAHHTSHWAQMLQADGGTGRCFPAGHASAGFAFLGGWFAFRDDAPRVARAWLIAALAAGLVFGIGQQLRGAHFMSHTLWTGWICWSVAWIADSAFRWLARRRLVLPEGDIA